MALARLVDGVDRRQPHSAGAFSGGDFDRERIESATALLSTIPPSTFTPGRRFGRPRALGGWGVVGLQHEAGHSELSEAPGEREVVDPPRTTSGLTWTWRS